MNERVQPPPVSIRPYMARSTISGRVLIVDDEPRQRSVLAEMLSDAGLRFSLPAMGRKRWIGSRLLTQM